jgi:hypothetical protein
VAQLGFGLFHLCLNLLWALLHVHRGSLTEVGSLAYFFQVMHKARLSGHHPDYHTLLAALTQILHGIILNAWRKECGFPTLAAFAKSNPSPASLLTLADKILLEHATPMPEVEPKDDDGSSKTSSMFSEPKAEVTADGDIARRNVRLLTHDLTYVIEIIKAIAARDIGRVEDMLGSLAMMF